MPDGIPSAKRDAVMAEHSTGCTVLPAWHTLRFHTVSTPNTGPLQTLDQDPGPQQITLPDPTNLLYTRIGSDRGNPHSTIMHCIQNIHTHSNGTTAPSRKPNTNMFKRPNISCCYGTSLCTDASPTDRRTRPTQSQSHRSLP